MGPPTVYGLGQTTVSKEVETSNACVTCTNWWAKLFVINSLYEVFRACMWWAEPCPWHGDFLKEAADLGEEVQPSFLKAMDTCPLRGHRL